MHLRFDIAASSLPEALKERLLALGDQRITEEGVVVIKAQEHRSLEMNRADALARLHELVRQRRAGAARAPRDQADLRLAQRRLEGKAHRGEVKARAARSSANSRRRQSPHGQGKTIYTCRECGGTSPKWLGKCPHCSAWNTLEEGRGRAAAAAEPLPVA